jgi:4-hydroxybenzoate polyprenyltransferase
MDQVIGWLSENKGAIIYASAISLLALLWEIHQAVDRRERREAKKLFLTPEERDKIMKEKIRK